MKKQIIKFKQVGTSENGLPLYELDNSALNGQRPLPESFRATVIFLPPESTPDNSRTFSAPSKTLEGGSERIYEMTDKEL